MTQSTGIALSTLRFVERTLAGNVDRAQSAKLASPEAQKLVKAAGEFESMLLESLWKSMKETFTDPNDPDSDPTMQSFDDWGMKSMAQCRGKCRWARHQEYDNKVLRAYYRCERRPAVRPPRSKPRDVDLVD